MTDGNPPTNGSGGSKVICTVRVFRHGQGFHNCVEHAEALKLHDPGLTDVGKEEARNIAGSFPVQHPWPELVIVSPFLRTLQTATLAFGEAQETKFVAKDLCRELNNQSAHNHRVDVATRVSQFPQVDFSQVSGTGEEPDGSEFRPLLKDQIAVLRERALRFLEFLKQTILEGELENVAVVTHASFGRTLVAEVLGLGRHHSPEGLRTGEGLVLQLRSDMGSTNKEEDSYYWVVDGTVNVVATRFLLRGS